MPRVLYMRGDGSDSEAADDTEGVWDDSALVKAYDRVMASARRELGLEPATSDSACHQEETRDESWRVGDVCRACYTEDGIEYEADIISVETAYPQTLYQLCFVGYGNTQYCTEDEIKPSLGKKARKRQQKEAQAETEFEGNVVVDGSMSQHATMQQGNEVTSGHSKMEKTVKTSHQTKHTASANGEHATSGEVHRGDYRLPHHHSNGGYTPYHCNGYTSGGGVSHHPPPPPHPPHPPCFRNLPHVPPPPHYCGPPGNARVCDDEALSAMLMSWYLSGYHTGYYAGVQEAGYRRRNGAYSNH